MSAASSTPATGPQSPLLQKLRELLRDDFEVEVDLACRVAVMKAEDMSQTEICERLQLTTQQVRELETRLARIIERLE